MKVIIFVLLQLQLRPPRHPLRQPHYLQQIHQHEHQYDFLPTYRQCMKTNMEFDRTIELPRDRPFYLMQYQGMCQLIRGMFFTAVSLTWWTEVDHITTWAETGKFDKQ